MNVASSAPPRTTTNDERRRTTTDFRWGRRRTSTLSLHRPSVERATDTPHQPFCRGEVGFWGLAPTGPSSARLAPEPHIRPRRGRRRRWQSCPTKSWPKPIPAKFPATPPGLRVQESSAGRQGGRQLRVGGGGRAPASASAERVWAEGGRNANAKTFRRSAAAVANARRIKFQALDAQDPG